MKYQLFPFNEGESRKCTAMMPVAVRVMLMQLQYLSICMYQNEEMESKYYVRVFKYSIVNCDQGQ